LSVFYTASADDVTTELATFFNAIKAGFPTSVTWTIPSSGDEIESTTGTITGSWVGGTAAAITATGSSAIYAAGTGGYIRWQTGNVLRGRRVKGRTFLCPVLADQYDASGTINNAVLASWQTAANTLAATAKLQIWSRPTVVGNDGAFSAVNAAVAPDKVTSLHSRRS
jgi:type II secretory pathway component GspD/PulD (secretin)